MLNGTDLTGQPLRKRRAMLEGALVPQKHRVELSSCRLMRTAKELADAFVECEASALEGLMVKDITSKYVPGDRKLWHKLKKDYLEADQCEIAGMKMADSVDLVVLGAFPGSGKKTHLLSSFLLGCWNEEASEWQLVCKLANGFSEARLGQLKALLTDGGDASLMVQLDASVDLPDYLPSAAKGLQRPTHVWRKAPSLSTTNLIFEVKGTEFTTGSKATGSSVSIRFPRLVRERDDKGLEDATTASELRDLVTLGDNGAKPNSVVTISALGTSASAASGGGGAAGGSNDPIDDDGFVADDDVGAAGASADAIAPANDDDDDDDDDPAQQDSPVSRQRIGVNGAQTAVPPSPLPAPADPRPLCKYGKGCYRKNAAHLAEYRHDEDPICPPAGANAPQAKRKGKARVVVDDDDDDDEMDEDDRAFLAGDGDDDDDGGGADWEAAPTLPTRLRERKPTSYANQDEDEDEGGGDGDDSETEDEDAAGAGSGGGDDATMSDAEAPPPAPPLPAPPQPAPPQPAPPAHTTAQHTVDMDAETEDEDAGADAESDSQATRRGRR